MASNHGASGCIAVCDGTPAILSQRPGIDSEVYWSRKIEYSINLQLYCDDTRLIRYYQVGWPGSVYDSNVFSKCKIAKHPEAHLSPGELLIGDAGYMLLW